MQIKTTIPLLALLATSATAGGPGHVSSSVGGTVVKTAVETVTDCTEPHCPWAAKKHSQTHSVPVPESTSVEPTHVKPTTPVVRPTHVKPTHEHSSAPPVEPTHHEKPTHEHSSVPIPVPTHHEKPTHERSSVPAPEPTHVKPTHEHSSVPAPQPTYSSIPVVVPTTHITKPNPEPTTSSALIHPHTQKPSITVPGVTPSGSASASASASASSSSHHGGGHSGGNEGEDSYPTSTAGLSNPGSKIAVPTMGLGALLAGVLALLG